MTYTILDTIVMTASGILFVIILTYLVYRVGVMADIGDGNTGYRKKMKFKTFRIIYETNPERYRLDALTVRMLMGPAIYGWIETVSIYFSCIDTGRYLWWKYRCTKYKQKVLDIEQEKKILTVIYEDIENFKEKNPIITDLPKVINILDKVEKRDVK